MLRLFAKIRCFGHEVIAVGGQFVVAAGDLMAQSEADVREGFYETRQPAQFRQIVWTGLTVLDAVFGEC